MLNIVFLYTSVCFSFVIRMSRTTSLGEGDNVRKQRGHAFSLDHVLVASDEAPVPDARI